LFEIFILAASEDIKLQVLISEMGIKIKITRRVAVYLRTHCNIGSKRAYCPLVNDVEL